MAEGEEAALRSATRARGAVDGDKAKIASENRASHLRGDREQIVGWHDFPAAVRRALEHRRLFVLLPVLAIGGLAMNAGLDYDPAPAALGFVGFCLISLIYLMRRSAGWSAVSLAMGAVWLGVCLPAVHGALNGGPMLAYPSFGNYRMVVDRVISVDETAQRVVVSEIVAIEDARDVPVRRARLFVRGGPRLGAGDEISGRFRFAPVPAPVVPGGFDFQFHSYFDGIGAYASSVGQVDVVQRGASGFGRWLSELRQSIGMRIDRVLDQPYSAIARALIIGDQSQLPDESRDMMAAAGLAHVLAISGLHLTLVAGGVYVAIRAGLAMSYGLGQRIAVKKLAAVSGGVIAIFYLALSGASVSAIRATIMLLLVFGAVLFGRRALTMRNVAIAALLVILTDPAAVFRPGFQLSFAAVAALIAAYELARGGQSGEVGIFTRVLKFFGGVALTSLIAGAATLVFAVYHFQQTAPLGVLGNIAALPIVGFVVLPACLIAVLLMPLGLEAPALHVMAAGTELILGVAERVAAWSAPIDAAPILGAGSLLIALGAIGWLAFFNSRVRLLGPVLAAPLVVLFGFDVRPDVLIADSSQAVAVRHAEGMELIAGRAPSFATDAWAETYIEAIAPAGAHSSCDGAGCVAQSPAGFKVALVKRADGFGEDCYFADLVVTRLDAPGWCRAHALVVDRDDLRLGGVHWLKWNGQRGSFEVRRSVPNPNRAWRKPF